MIRSRQHPGTRGGGENDVLSHEEIEAIQAKDGKFPFTSAWEIFASEHHSKGQQYYYSKRAGTFLLLADALLFSCMLILLRVTIPMPLHLFYMYYQPLFPPIFMLFLWGVAVRYFEQNGIQYELCFSKDDRKYLLVSTAIFHMSFILLAIVLSSACAFLYLSLYSHQGLAGWQPALVYAGLCGTIFLPHPFLYQDTRRFFASTMWRVVLPIRPVTWTDFLVADVLTSLAKSISDGERALSRMVSRDKWGQEPGTGSGQEARAWLVPLFLALPYLWRLLQCTRVYFETGTRSQLVNALKYFSAFPVILLSSMKYYVSQEAWHQVYKPLWLVMAVTNSTFSYYWDLERDWELPFFSRLCCQAKDTSMTKPLIHTMALYRRPFYFYLIGSNAILRLSWIYKLSPHVRHNYVAVFAIVLAECFRRFQWLFVRIEVELRRVHHSSHLPTSNYLPQRVYKNNASDRVPKELIVVEEAKTASIN